MSEYLTIQHFNTLKPNIALKYCGGFLFVINNENVLMIFDNNYKLKRKVQLPKSSEVLHAYSHAYSIMNKSISIPSNKSIILAQYENNKVVPKIKYNVHNKEIIFTQFCNTGNYMLTSCAEGRTYIFDCKTKAVRYTFPNQPDHCSYASFSQKNIFVFLSYYNSENVLLNLSNDTLYKFKNSVPITNAIFFDDDKKLFLCDTAGNSIIHECISNETISKKALFNDWVSNITLSKNKKFILIGTRTNNFYILDPYQNKILKKIKLENSGVTSIDINEETLFLSFVDATVQVIDMGYKKMEFITHIALKEYDKAKEVLRTNAFLYIGFDIEKFNDGFEEIYEKAKNLIKYRKISEAEEIIKPFKDNPLFTQKINLLFTQKGHIVKFVEAVESKNIQKSYDIAKLYPIVESLSDYENLEKQWEIAFFKARKILEGDSLRGRKTADEILEPYKKVTQKSKLVSQLVRNANKFTQADKYIKKQDFSGFFTLCKSFPLLEETFIYKKVEALGESLYSKALASYSQKNYDEANITFNLLSSFPSFKNIAIKEMDRINTFLELDEAIKKDEKDKIYTLVGKYSYLQFNEDFVKYNKAFENTVRKALRHAQSKNIQKAILILNCYFKLPTIKNKIDNCLKQAYQKEIRETEIDSNLVGIAVGNYKSLFGLDSQIKDIFTQKGFLNEYFSSSKSDFCVIVDSYPNSIFCK